jgi:C4-dicarboxylate transporter
MMMMMMMMIDGFARFLPSIGLTIIELEIIQKCLRSNKVPIRVISGAALVSNEMQNMTITPSSIAMLGRLSWVQQVNE